MHRMPASVPSAIDEYLIADFGTFITTAIAGVSFVQLAAQADDRPLMGSGYQLEERQMGCMLLMALSIMHEHGACLLWQAIGPKAKVTQ